MIIVTSPFTDNVLVFWAAWKLRIVIFFVLWVVAIKVYSLFVKRG